VSSPALDLLARTVAEELSHHSCDGCGGALRGARVRLSALSEDRVGVEYRCPGCGKRAVLAVGPEASDGAPRLL
jgi:predicted RNA-binding Zn-ribbon protein involved in translation (DUF1610 family)